MQKRFRSEGLGPVSVLAHWQRTVGRNGNMPAKVGKHAKPKKSPYVKDDNPELKKLVQALCTFVKRAVPGVKETVNSWGIPTFEKKEPFCFYMVGKNHVTFGFHFGTSLLDPEGLLEGTGKNLRHVKLPNVEDLKQTGLRELVRAAARLEGEPKMQGMRGK
jgi:hypothetical protein